MALIDLVGGSNYLAVSRDLCVAIGPTEAILYCELVDQYRFWRKCEKLDDDGMFFSTVEQIQTKIGLSKDQQPRYLQKLTTLGLIKVVRKGIPAKRYVLVYENPQFLRILYTDSLDEPREIQKSQNAITCNRKTRQLEIAKCDGKLSQNPAETNLYITNQKNNNNANGVVVGIFHEKGIDIRPVLRQQPEIFSGLSAKEMEKLATTLSEKQAVGKITNPVGLLLSSFQTVSKAILEGTFYPDAPLPAMKKKKISSPAPQNDDYEIYIPPTT